MELIEKRLRQIVAEEVANALAKFSQSLTPAERQSTQELASRKEVCEFLKISPPTFHDLANKGALPVIKVGRKTFCDMVEIRRLVAAGRLGRYKHIERHDR